MTREEIISLAREASSVDLNVTAAFGDFLEAFGRKVEAKATEKEREACAQVCLKKGYSQDGSGNRYLVFKNYSPEKCAKAIRARGAA